MYKYYVSTPTIFFVSISTIKLCRLTLKHKMEKISTSLRIRSYIGSLSLYVITSFRKNVSSLHVHLNKKTITTFPKDSRELYRPLRSLNLYLVRS